MLPTNSSCFTKAVNYPHLSTFILMINSLSIPGSVCETPDYESKNKRRRLLIKVRNVIQLKYIYSIGYYFKFNNINNTNRIPKKDREIKLFWFFVKFGGNLFFISMVFLFFFLNPIKSCRYVCFLVTLKTPHH